MRKQIVLFIAAISLLSTVSGQEKPASIAGSVKDSRTKAPLVEAVVTISSPVLQGQKFAVTDSTGFYKVPDLPSGIYTVSFEMEGFRKYSQENIKLNSGMSIGVSMEMARDRRPIVEQTKSKKRDRYQEVVTIN